MIGNLDGVDNDYIAGWAIDRDDPARHIPIDVFYNGRLLTRTVAGFARPELAGAGAGDGSNGFYVALPALDEPEEAQVHVLAAETGEPIGDPHRSSRQPKRSRSGIAAADMLRLHTLPLHRMYGLSFDGDHLVITGFHLPPGGNPSALTVSATPGTAFEFTYPQYVPTVAGEYWYWPNAPWSGYRLEIDLAASDSEGPHFEFTFDSGLDDPAAAALGRNRIHVPKDLGVYQRFPYGDQLTRVQRFDSSGDVALGGYTHYRVVAQIAEHYGVDLPAANVLDWGCGHGRVIRHFAQQGQAKQAWGVDIDPENAGWLAANLPAVRAATVPLHPPTDLPTAHFDLVYGISVMTHLTREVQEEWLAELKRVTRPGGLVILTFAGLTNVAYASRYLDPAWLLRWQESGYDDSSRSEDLDELISDPGYYRNTKQSAEVTRALWGRHFEVVDIHPCMFGYQDAAVLRG